MKQIKNMISKNKKIAIPLVIILTLLIAVGIYFIVQLNDSTNKKAENPLETAHINITADMNWTKDSTPAIVHIEGNEVDFYHAVAPTTDNVGTYDIDLAVGSYEVQVISPVNNDGSAYELFETGKPQTLTVEDTDDENANTVEMKMTFIPADKVTDEMLTTIVNDTKNAIAKGDESLKGESGKAVLEVLNANIKENPNAETAIEASEEAKTESTVDEAPVETPADKETEGTQPTEKPTEKPATQPTEKPAEKPAPAPTQPTEKPASHTHDWKEHYATKQVWVSKIVPQYETKKVQTGTHKVSDGSYWHCNCGAVIPMSKYEDHTFAHVESDEPSNGYLEEHFHDEPTYEEKQVQVGTKDEGHYETQSYVDYYYCDCGARK